MKFYTIILYEDKNRENRETEEFGEVCGHNNRVNDKICVTV